MPLSDTKLRALKPGPKPQKLADFEGLFILVNPNGSRLWRLAYRFGGKQKLLALVLIPTCRCATPDGQRMRRGTF